MKTYRLRISPQTSFLTPWQADTIFGSLCWTIAWTEGTDVLKNLLNQYINADPPFIISDGMPGDYLPAPLNLSLVVSGEVQTYEEYKNAKELNKLQWLSLDDFQSVCHGKFDTVKKNNLKTFIEFTSLHSSINRNTGTTGDEGSLFELEEYMLNTKGFGSDIISLYLRIKEGWEDKVLSLFHKFSLMGYGKKKSVGKGSFEVVGKLEIFDQFDYFPGSNGFVSLSNFVPAKNDPTEGFYKTIVKYGKLGGEYAFSGNPFKKPLLMFEKASVFIVRDSPKPFYGRMIQNIAPLKPEVVHYAYAFAVPAVISI